MTNKMAIRLKGYTYSTTLEDYLNEKLQIEKIKKIKIAEGSPITVTDKRKIRNNDVKKVNVLNNHVFRSMANLTYFFEFLYMHDELKGVFDKDIEELFGLKGPHSGQNQLENRKYSGFLRLLEFVLYYGNSITDKDKNKKQVSRSEFDFSRNIRLQLARITAREVNRLIYNLSKEKDKKLANIISQDFKRIETWIEYCTSEIKPNTGTPHRRIES